MSLRISAAVRKQVLQEATRAAGKARWKGVTVEERRRMARKGWRTRRRKALERAGLAGTEK